MLLLLSLFEPDLSGHEEVAYFVRNSVFHNSFAVEDTFALVSGKLKVV